MVPLGVSCGKKVMRMPNSRNWMVTAPSPAPPPPGCRFHTRCPHAKPRCSQERPLAEALPGGRQVACHFWRDVQNAGSGAPLVASVSAKLSERLALYRDRQAATMASANR